MDRLTSNKWRWVDLLITQFTNAETVNGISDLFFVVDSCCYSLEIDVRVKPSRFLLRLDWFGWIGNGIGDKQVNSWEQKLVGLEEDQFGRGFKL